MVTPAGVVTFLKASSRPFHLAPSWAAGETLDPACWFMQRRHFGVITSLEALSRLLVESHVGNWSQVGHFLERGRLRHYVHWHRRCLVGAILRSSLVLQSTRRSSSRHFGWVVMPSWRQGLLQIVLFQWWRGLEALYPDSVPSWPGVGQGVCACCVLLGVRCSRKGFMYKVFRSGFPHKLDQCFSF
jgi:hypothetical protein